MGTGRRLFLLLAFVAPLASAQSAPRDLCSRFTAAEMAELLGAAVEDGEPAAMGTGCQWFGTDEESYVIIQVLDSTYWLDPQGAPGYEIVDGAGKQAYSHPEDGGWRAMAATDDSVAAVVMIGHSAQRESAVTLLRRVVDEL